MQSERSADRHCSRRLTIYNHKGGVGKTVLTTNIAAALARRGKRVLLVDSDPQCNLSSYLVEDTVLDKLLDYSDGPHGSTIWSSIRPVFELDGDVHPVAPIEWMVHGVFLLAGDIRLSDYELELGHLWGECFQRRLRAFKGTTALSRAVNDVARQLDIDYVFYDAGPNVGALNRAILLDCDYFIVPAACDLFSIRALKTLGRTLQEWIRDWRTVAELAPDGVYLLPGKPKFLGYIPQRFRIYGGQVTEGQSAYLARIEKQVGSDIVAVLRSLDPTLAATSMKRNKLGQIKDFGTIVAKAQAQGVPIFEVDGASAQQKEMALEAFSSIADNIIKKSEGSSG